MKLKKVAPQPELVWHHGSYLLNLPEQPGVVIREEFQKMLGGVLRVGVVTSEEQVRRLKELVGHTNACAALLAQRTPARTYRRLKVVVWRGCWAIVERERDNRRRLDLPATWYGGQWVVLTPPSEPRLNFFRA